MVVINGKRYPDERYLSLEGMAIDVTEQGFNLIIVISNISKAEEKAFRTGKLKYGVYTQNAIPFFLLSYPEVKMTLDAPFNFLNVSETHRTDWLKSEANGVSITVIEKKGYKVVAQRFCGLRPSAIALFKQAAAQQPTTYLSKINVDKNIENLLRFLPTEIMIQRSEMLWL